MKTPFTCHILIPENLRANPLFQIPEGIKQELTCEYYQTVSPEMMECGKAIQLVVLHEEAFESWPIQNSPEIDYRSIPSRW